MSLTKHEEQRLKNFISNIHYYCEYFKKPIPDDNFIEECWKKEIPLDEVVALFVKKLAEKKAVFAYKSRQPFR
jgi:predicted amidophosphoribosyltransferase